MITAVRVDAARVDGRIPAARHPGHPAARCVDVCGRVRDPGLQLHLHRRLHEHDSDRRLPRRGRPEATYALERTMDALARELGIDRIELRRRNFITEFPATIASGLTIDSGDYHASLDMLPGAARLRGDRGRSGGQARARRRQAARRRLLDVQRDVRTRAVAHPRAIRYAAGGWDTATIRCLPTGTFQVVTGTSPHGQGHETAWAQIVADQLGCGTDEVEVLHGDTSDLPARPRHVRQPQPAGRRRRALQQRARRSSRRRGRSLRTSSRSRPTISSTQPAPSR